MQVMVLCNVRCTCTKRCTALSSSFSTCLAVTGRHLSCCVAGGKPACTAPLFFYRLARQELSRFCGVARRMRCAFPEGSHMRSLPCIATHVAPSTPGGRCTGDVTAPARMGCVSERVAPNTRQRAEACVAQMRTSPTATILQRVQCKQESACVHDGGAVMEDRRHFLKALAV